MSVKNFITVLVVVVMAWAAVAPNAHAARMLQSVPIDHGEITWDHGLGLDQSTVTDDCEILEVGDNEILHCVYLVTVLRTSNFWGDTKVNVYMPMYNIVDDQPAYLYKNNNEYDNEKSMLWIRYGACGPIANEVESTYCLWNETSSPEEFITSVTVPYLQNADIDEWFNLTVEVYYSHGPISTCDDSFIVLDPDDYEMDPTIETPVGSSVVPGDDQIYTTVPDQFYRLWMTGGPWNNGTTQQDRDMFQYSWDGVTWLHFSEESCIDQVEGGDLVMIYIFQAESETFYIRVWDEPDEFADNFNDPDAVFYHIALTIPATGCESQYTYDEFEDVIGYVGVDSTEALGAHLNNVEELEVGEWYVIRYGTGTWTDDGGAEQTDVEYNWLPHTTGWSDLTDEEGGGDAVWCVSVDGTETLFQAHATNIFLRANDGDADFTNNDGTVYYTIYRVTFERKLQPCELTVNIGAMIEAIIVDADKWNGSPVGTAMEQTIQPGGWYVLDTTLGPWRQTTGSDRYDMAINDRPAGEDGTWIELEDFAASCNIETDTLGHRRIIFQAPDDYAYDGSNGHYYRLRVDRQFLGLYIGSMGWQLYGATSTASVVDTCLDGLNLQVINEFEWIDEKNQNGELLLSDNIRWPEYTALVPGVTYVVQAPVEAIDQCAGDAGSECKFQVSNDGGATWYVVDDEVSPLTCAVKDDPPSSIWRARFTAAAGEIWKIRVNDMDGNFINNSGATAFKFYKDCSGEDCIPIDEDELPAVSVQGGGDVCKIAIMRPGPLNAEALINLGTYLGNWTQYLNLSILRYMAWCPRHTGTLESFFSSLRNKEPFASFAELDDMQERVREEIESYDWGENAGQAESIFEMTASGELREKVEARIFGNTQERSVWEGGNAISFSDTSLPDSYYSCNSAFTNALPSGLRTGVCFVSAYFIETSASFWIQLMIDISALFAAIMITKTAVLDLVYLLTGVRLQQASLSQSRRTIVDLGRSDAARRQEAMDENEEILRNQFGGRYRKNGDGSYSRR